MVTHCTKKNMLKIADKNFKLLNIFYLHWNVHEILGLVPLQMITGSQEERQDQDQEKNTEQVVDSNISRIII